MRISDWSSDVCSSDLGWRTSSCAASVPAVHEADEDLLQRTLAGIEVLEVDAVRGQPAQQVGDAGFLGLGVEGVDQRLAIVGQLERPREIGRVSCRERVCQYVYISVVAV